MARSARGQEDAFAELYDLTSSRIHAIILRVLRSPDHAAEVTQEVYVEVWRQSARYSPDKGSVVGWMTTMAHRRAVDRVRSVSSETARDERYGLDVWQRIRSRLPERATGAAFGWIDWRTPAVAASLAVAVVAVWSLGSRSEPIVQERAPAAVVLRGTGGDAVLESRRILLMSVADHLERSDRVLTDIINAPAGIDISVERGWAEDLLWTGRIYRQNALEADERSVAAVLDDLERTLLDIVHAPPALSESQLHAVRARVESGALLFKVRVLRDDLTESGGGAVRIPRDGVEVS